jgi:virginiamycin A acetyltransferase
MTGLRDAIKWAARAAATLVILPALGSFHIRAAMFGADRALMASTQALGLIPGLLGQYLRRAFLAQVLASCAPSAAIEFGTSFSDVGTRIDEHVYIGPNCHIGLAHIERDVLIAPCVHIPSGGMTHGSANPDVPMRDQAGERRLVRIGANSWIGSAAVVMADVGAQTIVGAGAVVTRPIPPRSVAAGVPARVVRSR